jgi:hypothetical protein
LVTDCEPAPPAPDVDAGVVADVLVELALAGAELALLVLLLLLEPQPVATIAVATSVATPSHPLRACVVTSSSSGEWLD